MKIKFYQIFMNLISIISSLFYQIKLQFFFFVFFKNKKYLNPETNLLKKDGYIHLKKIIPRELISDLLKKYEQKILIEKNNTTEFYKFDIKLDNDNAKVFLDFFKKKNILSICRDYLGKIGILECKINYQNKNDCENDSMQPHHDTRATDLKIYVWLSDYNVKSHPLYYLKGSNNSLKFYIKYEHHRKKKIPKEKMVKIYGEKGDVIIFDTHGWHSHTKINTAERVVLETTIIPKNFFFNSFEKENEKLKKFL